MIVATRTWASAKLNHGFNADEHTVPQRQCKVTDKTPIRSCRRCSDALQAAHATIDERVPFLRARRASLLDSDHPIIDVNESLCAQLEVGTACHESRNNRPLVAPRMLTCVPGCIFFPIHAPSQSHSKK